MIGTSKSIWGFDPRTIPGCQLWLDGSDVSVLFSDVAGTSAITTNGQTIRCWKDKSGRGCNATQAGNAPIWNSSNYVNFTQSLGQFMNLPNGTLPFASGTNAYSIFAVANLNNTSSGLKTIIGNGSAGTNSFNALQIQTQSIANLWYNNDVAGGSLTANTFFIANIAFDGSTRYIYQNGTSVNTTASSGWAAPNTNNVIGVEPATGNWYYDGNIGEILVYNTALTTSQRQQVEGYLAHKWGLAGYYVPSTPVSIPGCQLWLDGADSSTITGTTSVTAWADKSGLGNNATTYSGTISYSSSLNALLFSDSGMQTSIVTPTNRVGSGFFVVRVTNPSPAGSLGVFQGSAGNGGRQFRNDGGTTLRTVKQNVLDMFFSGTTVVNNLMIVGYIDDGTNLTHSVNGTLYTTTNAATFESGTIIQIGKSFNNEYLIGYIHEVVLFSTALTTTQRQTIEGYLARKWGLTSMYGALPSIHPFYSIRPHLRGFQPNDIDGCQLWLDAADQSSLVLSGSSVTTWNDKSGNGYHMNTLTPTAGWTGSAAYPTIGTSINGLQTVNFVAQSGLKQSTTLDGVKNLFWVGRIAAAVGSSAGGFANFFLLGHDSHYDWHPPIGEKFILSGVAQSGIADASPASLFTNDANAVTNTAFKNINLPSPPNVSLLSVSGITGTTRYQGICYDRTTHTGWCGDLAEVLIFSTALTTSQRQQVEGYLAHKWGLTPYLPLMSPLSIPGCSLWLDGADQSSMTFSSGSNISQWRDKSGLSNNATGFNSPVLTTNSINGNQAIATNSTAYFIGPVSVTGTTLTVFCVAKITILPNGQNDQRLVSLVNGNNVDYGRTDSTIALFNQGNTSTIALWRTSGPIANNAIVANTPFLAVSGYDGTNGYLWKDGSAGTLASNASSGTFAITKYGVGGGAYIGEFWSGSIGEVLIYTTFLTTSQRQQIEGYLVRKWGITISTTLPSTHPFKSIPPASLPFSPRNISGLQLWLDGADTTSMTLSGSNVTQWNDKSGNGRNPTTSSSANPPTYISSNKTVNFVEGSSQALSIPQSFGTALIGQTMTMFFVGQRTVSSGWAVFLAGTTGSRQTLQFGFFNNQLFLSAYDPDYFTNITTYSSPDPVRIYEFEILSSSLATHIVNGSQISSDNRNFTPTAFLNPDLGRRYGNTYSSFNLSEMIAFSPALTAPQRQQVEGYLAHKWGLAESLPSTHPFKKFPA